jgi:hypothetical protein
MTEQTTPTREQILKACIDAGLLTESSPPKRTEKQDKYQAYVTLAPLFTEAKDPMASARTAVWNLLNRVYLGLDPLKENRGGVRPGSGRKAKIVIQK